MVDVDELVVAGPVTAAQVVAGHVRLDISCLDRLYLTGHVAKLQSPGGVIYFLHDRRGKPIASRPRHPRPPAHHTLTPRHTPAIKLRTNIKGPAPEVP